MKRFLSILTALVAVPASAQEPVDTGGLPADTFALEQLIVTATRQPLPLAAVPAAVTVLSGTELRQRGARLLVDALRLSPGTPVAQTGSYGGLASLYMRGGESDYVQVLVDGVPINQPGGAIDFAHIRVEDVERVEIVRGPVSVLYGSDAVTGVIHIFTREGRGRPRLTGSISGGRSGRVGPQADGSFGTLALDAGLTGSTNGLAYAATVARFATNGAYAFNNDYSNTTASTRIGWSDRHSSVRVNGRFVDSEFHYPTDAAGRLSDRNAFRTGRSLAVGASGSHAFTSRVGATVDLALYHDDTGNDDRPDSAADTLGFYASDATASARRYLIDGRIDFAATPAALLTVGAAAEAQKGETESLSLSDFGPFADSAEYERDSRAGYAQLLLTATEKATFTAGVRVDDGDYGAFFTWRAGASIRPGRWVIRAAAGSGFKEPTFYENYARGFVIGNPELDPERSLSFEIGLERTLLDERITLGATAFTQRFEDLIQYTFAPTRPGESNYFNLGAARARGIEASAQAILPVGLRLTFAHDWLDTEVTESGDAGDNTFVEGARLLRRPEHRTSATLAWSHQNVAAWLGVTRVGNRQDIDFSDAAAPGGERVDLDSYTLVNAALEAPLARGERGTLTGTLRIENVFDARFEEIVGFPARARAVHLGVKAGLGF